MMSRLKRSSALLVFFPILFSAGILFLSIRQLHGEDSSVSGGAEGSTSVVTGTNEECKEPGGTGTVECIVHTHVYTTTETTTNCVLASYAAPTDDSIYSINTEITVCATQEGSNTAGKTKTTYSSCTVCGQSYPGTNPSETPHNPTWPTVKWEAKDCGAVPATGTGTTATFTATEASSSLNSSSVVFSTNSPGTCDKCGTLTPSISPTTTKFTVVKVVINGFTPENTFAWADGCDSSKHKAQCNAAIIPDGTGLKIKYEIVGEKHGAEIDGEGVITPSPSESGIIRVRASIESKPESFDEKDFEIKARPVAVISSTVTRKAPVGGLWTHTFSGTGGSLEGCKIHEDIATSGWPFCKDTPYVEIGGTWILDSNGTMDAPDYYRISGGNFDIPYIYTSDKTLPLTGGVAQDYLWDCPFCGDVKITGPSNITWGMFDVAGIVIMGLYTDYHAGGEPLVFPYEGPAYLTNVVLAPPSIPADGESTSDASVTIIPSTRGVIWSIEGNKLGVERNWIHFKAGTTTGTIVIKAKDTLSDSSATGELILTKPSSPEKQQVNSMR